MSVSSSIKLPSPYSARRQDSVDDIRLTARELAADSNTEDGTLVWTQKQSDGVGRLGKLWKSSAGDLHTAVIIDADFPAENIWQLGLVNTVAVGMALASMLGAMTSLRFRWPNDVLIGGYKVSGGWLDVVDVPGADKRVCISQSTNLLEHAELPDLMGISTVAADPEAQITADMLLESYAREFLSYLNVWAERGMTPILKPWRSRLEGNESLRGGFKVELLDRIVSGEIEAITDEGNARLFLPDGSRHIVTLREFFETA